jgi:hypothetical protein
MRGSILPRISKILILNIALATPQAWAEVVKTCNHSAAALCERISTIFVHASFVPHGLCLIACCCHLDW